MRSFVSYLVFSFLFVCAAFPSFAQQSADPETPASAIQFQTQRIDLGDTLYKRDFTYVYRFVYENTGSAPLIVNKVVGHCPCVTVTHSSEPLPPGGRDTLTVFFVPTHPSKYSQRISVFNNSSRSVVTLYAKGNFLNPSAIKKE